MINASNAAIVLGVLLGVSESLALIPQVKANSIYQLIINLLKALVAAEPQPPVS